MFPCAVDAMPEVSRNFLALAVISIFLNMDWKQAINLERSCALYCTAHCRISFSAVSSGMCNVVTRLIGRINRTGLPESSMALQGLPWPYKQDLPGDPSRPSRIPLVRFPWGRWHCIRWRIPQDLPGSLMFLMLRFSDFVGFSVGFFLKFLWLLMLHKTT